jgi:hypothetical protein
MQDLFKPSIQLEEDVLVCLPRTSPDEGASVPIPGTPVGENGPTLTPEANLRTSTGPIAPSPGPEVAVVAVVGPPSPEVDWRKPITEYL